jgi:hypothetical protein
MMFQVYYYTNAFKFTSPININTIIINITVGYKFLQKNSTFKTFKLKAIIYVFAHLL